MSNSVSRIRKPSIIQKKLDYRGFQNQINKKSTFTVQLQINFNLLLINSNALLINSNVLRINSNVLLLPAAKRVELILPISSRSKIH